MRGCIDVKSSCVVGFDVWGTLLDLEKILGAIAEIASSIREVDKALASQSLFRLHEEMKTLRRINPSLKPADLLEASRISMMQALGISGDELGDLFNEVFNSLKEDNIVFSDVLPALKTLKTRKIRMGVVGNVLFWPSKYTIKLLENTGIASYIEHAVFSDEVGVSKPDRGIFLFFSEIIGVSPENLIYVGDNVVEDVGGALAAGAIGVLVNRKAGRTTIVPELRVALINSLDQVISVYKVFCENPL